MFAFFDFLVNLISSIINMVVGLISMIIFIFEFVAKGVAYVLVLLALLPPFVQVPVIAIVMYTIVITVVHLGE